MSVPSTSVIDKELDDLLNPGALLAGTGKGRINQADSIAKSFSISSVRKCKEYWLHT